MHSPETMIYSLGPVSLWHKDPCNKPGCRDDSCGWFMRASHGDPKVLAKIRHQLETDFDRVFNSYGDMAVDDREAKAKGIAPQRVYHTGLFCPNGDANFSVHAIVLNMFFTAARVHFGTYNRSSAWMRKNLFDILMFAENPFDSLRDGIVGTFRIACGEKWDREEALDKYASCIYGWILRSERPWYRHPRWHVHHWEVIVYWRSLVPRFLRRRIWPENVGSTCCAKPAPGGAS